jgi:alpha 1,2-mannosyltransferase
VFRFQSGFFFRHPLLDQYDYYWRVEPDVDYYCDIDYDVFKFMRDNNKKYGTIHRLI